MLAIGLMSGTSMDAVDAAAVRFDNSRCTLVRHRQFPIPEQLQQQLRSAGPGTTIATMAELDARMGELFGTAARGLMEECRLAPSDVAVIGSHGQTLLHIPAQSHANTLQVGDPNRIAMTAGVRTVADLRRMDMAAGGQGAPLAPAFHAWCFRNTQSAQAVINIGGIANMSVLPPPGDGDVTGFDTGPGNTLMDQWIQQCAGQARDDEGTWAAGGAPLPALLDVLRLDPYFRLRPPKSTGREYFNLDWLRARGGSLLTGAAPRDVQATLLELTVTTIADALHAHAATATHVHVCGGGVFNGALMARLAGVLHPLPVASTAAAGIPPDAMEAMMVAWLAWRRITNVPASVPTVTGATRAVLLGAIYDPGADTPSG